MPLATTNAPKDDKAAAPKTALSKVTSFQRSWDDDHENAPSQTSTAYPWSQSPPRRMATLPTTTAGKESTDAYASMAELQAKLTTGIAKLTKAKAEFDAKVSSSAPVRPMKRKAETIELSDSDDDDKMVPQPKRHQPAKPTAFSAPVRKTVKPWDEDHTHKKLSAKVQPASVSTDSVKAKTANKKIAEIVSLSNQQRTILETVMEGKNVFFTGSAGTGKSVLLRAIIKSLRQKNVKSPDAVAVTASTGIAACNIGGVTLHSFGGVGIAQGTAVDLANKIKKNQKAASRWGRTRVLIIDEISMLEGDFFDKLETIARILRKNSKPFGGIQLVLTGDFFQLPPVVKSSVVKFAFNAQCWKDCMDCTFNLTKVFRQKDQAFVDMLNEMRFGRLSEKSIQVFTARAAPLPDDGIAPTELFPRREDVDRANRERMEKLTGDLHTYASVDGGTADPRSRENQLNNFMAPKELQLKVDAQVMMIKNVDEQLVNGTVGKVIDFMTESEWAASVVGMATGEKEPGEKEKPKNRTNEVKLPVVEWKIVGSRSPRIDLVRMEAFKVEGPNGQVEVSRQQLPLILAWAMSIHKSQGQTLEKVKVDLRKVFEKGQAYVAISRATSLEGLQVIGFQASKVYAHPAVIAWSKTLTSS